MPTLHPRITVLGLAVLAATTTPSCAVSGVPDPELGVPFREAIARRLANDRASRERMILQAGTPYYASADGSRIAYVSVWHRETAHIWFGVLGLMAGVDPSGGDLTTHSVRTYVVLVEFDVEGTARRSTSFSMYDAAPTDEELKQRIRDWFDPEAAD